MDDAQKRIIGRAMAARFINEGPEKIAKLIAAGTDDDKSRAVIARLERPVSARELAKWEKAEITDQQWAVLVEHREAADYFEQVVAKITAPAL